MQMTACEENKSSDGGPSVGDIQLCGQRRFVLILWGKIELDEFKKLKSRVTGTKREKDSIKSPLKIKDFDPENDEKPLKFESWRVS